MCNGRALAYSLALLHSTKSAIALLNERKLVTLLPLSKKTYLSSCLTSFGCQHDVAIYWHMWPSTDRQAPLLSFKILPFTPLPSL
jgi:hypothetical protein